MSRIILSDVALNGVQDAVVEEMTKEEKERYNKLVEEANERIKMSRREQSDAWFRAMNFRAKSNSIEQNKDIDKCECTEKVYRKEIKKLH